MEGFFPIMNYSKSHQNFSNVLQNPKALTNPQDFLGPNYETVLNFWTFIDSLTEDNWEEVAHRYSAIDHAAGYAARAAAGYAARVVAGDAAWDAARVAAWDAAWDAARGATYELIGMHTLLNDGKDLLFVLLFNDL
jgi:hypothetical protein